MSPDTKQLTSSQPVLTPSEVAPAYDSPPPPTRTSNKLPKRKPVIFTLSAYRISEPISTNVEGGSTNATRQYTHVGRLYPSSDPHEPTEANMAGSPLKIRTMIITPDPVSGRSKKEVIAMVKEEMTHAALRVSTSRDRHMTKINNNTK